MAELRKDYFLDRKVIVAPERGNKPAAFRQGKLVKSKKCFFCQGNERLSAKEIGRIGDSKNWRMRWILNKFPSVRKRGSSRIKRKGLLQSQTAIGSHEIIIETPKDDKQLWDLGKKDFVDLIKIYSERVEILMRKKNAKYVLAFKNHGGSAGASVYHSHSQILSLNYLPEDLKEEFEAYGRKSCNYCKVIKKEMTSKRKCFENSGAVSFTPYASRFNYELWIFPRRHVKRIAHLDEGELKDLAELLFKALRRLKRLNFPYNCVFKYSPERFNGHLKIELTPRLAKWAGVEIGTGLIINSVAPEKAAQFYREG